MTQLVNEIEIQAPAAEVLKALSQVNLLQDYDPGVTKSEALTKKLSGVGAERQCHLVPGGWFKERITEQGPKTLTFELFECTLPVKKLKHSYVVEDLGNRSRVSQVMNYELKYGLIGRLMDGLFVRKKWDAGIKGFMQGLKLYAEKGPISPARQN